MKKDMIYLCSIKKNIWRIRLVGRGRTIGNRVTCNRVPEFESLILRQEKPKSNLFGLGFSFCRRIGRFDSARGYATNRVRKQA